MNFFPRVGVDIVLVSHVAASLDRLGEAYTKRIFTADEIHYCASNPVLAPARFAARFAAKEAALKALHLDDEGLDLRNVEVKQTPGGWCELVLHGAAKTKAEAAGWASWSLSMSHEGDHAAAVVMVLASEGKGDVLAR